MTDEKRRNSLCIVTVDYKYPHQLENVPFGQLLLPDLKPVTYSSELSSSAGVAKTAEGSSVPPLGFNSLPLGLLRLVVAPFPADTRLRFATAGSPLVSPATNVGVGCKGSAFGLRLDAPFLDLLLIASGPLVLLLCSPPDVAAGSLLFDSSSGA